MDNITFADLLDKRDQDPVTPTVWKCVKTCKNYNCTYPDGSIDYFPETRERRCINVDIRSKLVNNFWESRCNNYQPK